MIVFRAHLDGRQRLAGDRLHTRRPRPRIELHRRLLDTRDARAADALRKSGLRVQCTQTIMRSSDDKAALARNVLSLVAANVVSDQPQARTASDQP